MQVHVNQHGYDPSAPKRAVVRGDASDAPRRFAVVDARDEREVLEGPLSRVGPVANWGEWTFWTADFDALDAPGRYRLRVESGDAAVSSPPFAVAASLHRDDLVPDLLHYFTSQRCRGRYERADRDLGFAGDREDTVDVRGGWYDASGDHSKYVSHLSYANYWNPQQIPLVVWSLVDAYERLGDVAPDRADALWERFLEEAFWGADFLVRACDEAGYFYTTVFDGWTKDPDRREVCAFETFEGTKTDEYQAGYREGGGMAIAALARASAASAPEPLDDVGAFEGETYLATAERAFEHLEEHNEAYLPDGTENLLDDYSALLAATELAAATGEERYRERARERARSLAARQTADDRYDGWFRAGDGDRPFFHATDEGLPVVALCRYLAVEDEAPDAAGETPDAANEAREAIRRFWAFERSITDDVANPYGLARQYVRDADADEPRASFFMPQDNETGYWWLGENARLASLAAAASRTVATLDDGGDTDRLRRFAVDQVDWILGCNPFGVSMFHGVGPHEPAYGPEHPNAPGGILNGITAGVEDEDDVAFLPDEYADDPVWRWRWAEQWLPHAAWFLQAVVWADR